MMMSFLFNLILTEKKIKYIMKYRIHVSLFNCNLDSFTKLIQAYFIKQYFG